jgi:O-acetyl-ADP-ribose deacetylase (regulator of RNase III)
MTGTSSQTIGSITLELRKGNIALSDTDAVVNAANEYLNLGAGVAGALRELGGEQIQLECNEIGFCPVGSAVITTGGNLKAKYVIHAVGPMYGEGDEQNKLRSAVTSALTLAEEKSLRSITFPAIGAGFFHYPLQECASTIVTAIRDAAPSLKSVNRVVICLKGDAIYKVFEKAILEY